MKHAVRDALLFGIPAMFQQICLRRWVYIYRAHCKRGWTMVTTAGSMFLEPEYCSIKGLQFRIVAFESALIFRETW